MEIFKKSCCNKLTQLEWVGDQTCPVPASAATASPSSLKPRAFSGLVGGGGGASPYPSTSPLAPPSSSKRAWKPGPQFYKPLAGGWKREVVYGRDPETGGWTEKPTSILYHAPKTPGLKAKVFKTIDELRTFSKYFWRIF